ncbi:unnamed protein product, partial [Clonostachys solani]
CAQIFPFYPVLQAALTLKDILCAYDARKGKPGLKTGAVESLTRRVEALESASIAARQVDDATPNNESTAIDGQTQTHLAGSLGALTTAIQTLSNKIESLDHTPLGNSGIPTLTASKRYAAREDDENASERHPKRIRVQDDHQASPLIPSQDSSPSAVWESSAHLPIELINDVVLLYFIRIHNWIPILHWKHFKQKIRQQEGREQFTMILDAMVVSTLKFVAREKYNLSGDDVQRISSKCRESLLLKAMQSLSVENLQALVILVFTDIGDGSPSKAWPIIGSLSRSVEYLQLSIEEDEARSRRVFTPYSILSAPSGWIEEEERRRLFWVIFNLDRQFGCSILLKRVIMDADTVVERFCSITTGWNTSLTADDVSRRLPADGTCFYMETPVSTPFFGIWDKSAASMGNSVAFLPAIGSATATRDSKNTTSTSPEDLGNDGGSKVPADLKYIGGLAYLIEATESLNRIATCFLHQNVNFGDQREIAAWLTRFKELDLRLVHWKIFLPTRWKDPNRVPNTSTGPKYHDHGMTLAHITHNTSIIILHSLIAYSVPRWYNLVQLPSSSSAETCRLAAIETTSIVGKYLSFCPEGLIVAPQLTFCVFISAKAHCYNVVLADEFWHIIKILEQMARRWAGLVRYEPNSCHNLAGMYAERLRVLQSRCEKDPGFRLDVLDYSSDLFSTDTQADAVPLDDGVGNGIQSGIRPIPPVGQRSGLPGRREGARTPERLAVNWNDQPFFMDSPEPVPCDSSSVPPRTIPAPAAGAQTEKQNTSHEIESGPVAISQAFMDQSFAALDRVIGLGDSLMGDDYMAEQLFTMPLEDWSPENIHAVNVSGGEN